MDLPLLFVDILPEHIPEHLRQLIANSVVLHGSVGAVQQFFGQNERAFFYHSVIECLIIVAFEIDSIDERFGALVNDVRL